MKPMHFCAFHHKKYSRCLYLCKNKYMRCLSIVFLSFLLGCSTYAQNSTSVSADEFEKGIADKTVQLLDVRTAGEYRTGHLKGALQANWNNQTEFTNRTSALDKNRPVYVYCLSGPRSSAAAEWLRSNGYTTVVELNGGFSSWKRNGKPVEGTPDQKQMTLADYQQQVAGKQYVLVDFGAEWCPPCKKMEPFLLSFVAANPQITLLKIDGGVHTDLMKQLNVDGIPTLLFLKNGTESWRKSGVVETNELNRMFSAHK